MKRTSLSSRWALTGHRLQLKLGLSEDSQLLIVLAVFPGSVRGVVRRGFGESLSVGLGGLLVIMEAGGGRKEEGEGFGGGGVGGGGGGGIGVCFKD